MAVSANRLELLQIADAVAREKSIDRQIVLASMEDAIQKAARSRYGQETEVRAEINPKTGEIKLTKTPTERANPYGMVMTTKAIPFVCDFGTNKIAYAIRSGCSKWPTVIPRHSFGCISSHSFLSSRLRSDRSFGRQSGNCCSTSRFASEGRKSQPVGSASDTGANDRTIRTK